MSLPTNGAGGCKYFNSHRIKVGQNSTGYFLSQMAALNRVYFVINSNEEAEEIENKKRDWKDEKNEEVTIKSSETAPDVSKDEDTPPSKNTADANEAPKDGDVSVPALDKDGKATSKKSEARHAESRYADVPMNRMFCHVCNKHMWDGYVSVVF